MTAMDNNNSVDSGDWKAQIQDESRQRIRNKIIETLKTVLPYSGPEGLEEIKNMGIRFEEKVYSTATSQSDYLRKISLKMLTMESKSQNTVADSLPSDSASNNQDLDDAVSAIHLS